MKPGMANKTKRTITIVAESDYEIHRLAKVWAINVTKAREPCYQSAAARMQEISPADLPLKNAADLRQAEAKVEILKKQ
jgi:hypothetical protein